VCARARALFLCCLFVLRFFFFVFRFSFFHFTQNPSTVNPSFFEVLVEEDKEETKKTKTKKTKKKKKKKKRTMMKTSSSSSKQQQWHCRKCSTKSFFLVIVALIVSTFSVAPSYAQQQEQKQRAMTTTRVVSNNNQNNQNGGGVGGGVLFATFDWEKYGIPKVAIKFNNLQLRKWIESENLRRCAVKANTENGNQCTQFMIRTFLGEDAIPVDEAMESVARDRNLYHAFARQEKAQNERIQSLEVQRGFLAAVAFVTTTALGLYMYTSRAAGLKIPVAALFSVLTKKSADDVEDKAIRMRQVNEDAKARARRLEDAINNLKKNESRV
jgi:hypothetical protein